MRAALTVAAAGGNIRFSTSTDSMLEFDEVICYVSCLSCNAWYCPAWHLQATDWFAGNSGRLLNVQAHAPGKR
jgi:hypothetical protein